MTIVVFSGPSLPRSEVEGVEGFVWRPPLHQGDLYRAALDRPTAIGVVDGFFETTPTVWHKEILWALSEGIPVYGAASIGALRAVELQAFGMLGVGRVFEMFRDGALEDDDEIALLHAPAELGYTAITEAMVNVRATLARAVGRSLLKPDDGARIMSTAKALFYKERTWSAILSAGANYADATCRALAAWLPDGRVDQKRLDARGMLTQIRLDLENGIKAPRPSFTLAHTVAWEAVVGEFAPSVF